MTGRQEGPGVCQRHLSLNGWWLRLSAGRLASSIPLLRAALSPAARGSVHDPPPQLAHPGIPHSFSETPRRVAALGPRELCQGERGRFRDDSGERGCGSGDTGVLGFFPPFGLQTADGVRAPYSNTWRLGTGLLEAEGVWDDGSSGKGSLTSP